MNLYEIFNENERELISNFEEIENRDYTKDELTVVEHKIIEDIMSNSKNDIQKVKVQYNGILDKLESGIGK